MLEDYAQSRKLFIVRNKPKLFNGKLYNTGNDKEKVESNTGVMYLQDDVVSGTNEKNR